MRRLLWLLPLCFSAAVSADETVEAIFAGGCFWCMEPPYDELDGVLDTTAGFIGGDLADPSYEHVVAGGTGHTEAVRVTYDPDRVDYEQLLAVFWRNIDPLDDGGQFCDRGDSYRSGIFYRDRTQREQARASKADVEEHLDQPVATEITEAGRFYEAEDYHQNYYRKNPVRYRYYVYRCGRKARLNELWGEEKP